MSNFLKHPCIYKFLEHVFTEKEEAAPKLFQRVPLIESFKKEFSYKL